MKKLLIVLIASTGIAAYSNKTQAQEVHKIAPTMYKVLSDTLGLRVMEATYRPGESSELHKHPDFAMYVLSGGTVEITSPEGKKQVVEFPTGMGVVLPGESHTAKNVGNTVLKLVVIEARRPKP